MTVRLSLVMNVYNEEELIAAAIESAHGVDEVVVADMESTDRTVEIARSLGAKVISLPYSGYCETGRQQVIDAASGDWCLMLDGDERLCDGGIQMIRELIEDTPDDTSAYLIPFHTYIGEHRIMASGWEADKYEYHERLFRKADVKWPTTIHGNPTFVGEKVDLPENLETSLFVKHLNFRDFTHLLEKFNRYTSTEASQITDGDGPPSLVRGLRSGFAEMIERYSPDEDGALSMALCLAMLSYRSTSEFKAAEKNDWKTVDGVPSKEVWTHALTAFWSTLGIGWMHEQRARMNKKFETDGNVEAATREVRRLLDVWGNEPHLLCDLGSLEFSAGHVDAALEHLRQAVAMKPDLEIARHNLEAAERAASAARVVRPQPRR